jgi:hypothetical protein
MLFVVIDKLPIISSPDESLIIGKFQDSIYIRVSSLKVALLKLFKERFNLTLILFVSTLVNIQF